MTYHDLDAQAIARALGGEVRRGCVLAPGPGHSPADRSLAIKIDPGAPEGFLVHSFASDDPITCKDYVRQKCGLPEFKPNGDGRRRGADMDQLFRAAAKLQIEDKSHGGRLIATFVYVNEEGAPLYEVLKFADPKTFRQRQPDGNGGWIWNLDGVRRVPYRLPDLLKYPSATVFICEGEKDADRVASLDLCATTVASGKWTDEIVEHFAGRDIMILQDNDEPGRKKAIVAAHALHGVAWTIRIVLLPDLPDAGDVSDWLDADASRAGTFADVCMDAPLWEPPADGAEPEPDNKPLNAPDGDDLVVIDAGIDDWSNIPPRGWLLGNIFCREFVSSLLGDGGVGKTALRYTQYLSLAVGRPLTGEHVFLRCRVLILSLEDSINELRRRIKAACAHHGIEQSELKGWLFYQAIGADGGKIMTLDQRGRAIAGALAGKIERTIVIRHIDLVALDPFVKSHSVEENDNSAIDDVVQILSDIATMHNVAVDTPHHVSKGTPDPGNADRGRGASSAKDAFRLVYTLTSMSQDEAKTLGIDEAGRRWLVRMDHAKVNVAPPATDATWFKLVSVAIGNATDLYPNGDNVQTVERWVPPDIWRDLPAQTIHCILDDIDKGIPEGSRYSAHKNAGARAVWKVITKHVPQKTEAQAKLVVAAWLKSGLLVEEEYHDEKARKDFLGLKVDNAKRPTGASI